MADTAFRLEAPPLRLTQPLRHRRTKSPNVPAPEWTAGFHDYFWPLAWRKAGKYAALQAWNRIQPQTQEHFTAIMDGATRAAMEYAKRDLQHRPHPSTWLNQRRWEDEDL